MGDESLLDLKESTRNTRNTRKLEIKRTIKLEIKRTRKLEIKRNTLNVCIVGIILITEEECLALKDVRLDLVDIMCPVPSKIL